MCQAQHKRGAETEMQANNLFLRGTRPVVSLLTGSVYSPRPPQALGFLCLSPSTAQWSHSPGASPWAQRFQLVWSATVYLGEQEGKAKYGHVRAPGLSLGSFGQVLGCCSTGHSSLLLVFLRHHTGFLAPRQQA